MKKILSILAILFLTYSAVSNQRKTEVLCDTLRTETVRYTNDITSLMGMNCPEGSGQECLTVQLQAHRDLMKTREELLEKNGCSLF